MDVTFDLPDKIGQEIKSFPKDFNVFAFQGLNDAILKYMAAKDFDNDKITLTELAGVLGKDHIDTIEWLKANGVNPPSIQAYSENGFTPEFEKRIEEASIEAEDENNLSPAFDNVKDAIAWLNEEARKINNEDTI